MEREFENIRRRPVWRNKEELRTNILNRIRADQSSFRNDRILWLRIAASFFIILSVSAYAWMEFNTQYQHFETIVEIDKRIIAIDPDWNCKNNLVALIESFESIDFDSTVDGNSIQLNKEKIGLLKKSKPEFYVDAMCLIQALESLYPQLYQQYNAGESIHLNLWQIKGDHRICQWIK